MVNFMAVHARGLICMPITADRANQLMLPPMVSDNESKSGTNFTISIEAAKGVTTGISRMNDPTPSSPPLLGRQTP